MNNINKDKLEEISLKIKELENNVNFSTKWSEKNKDLRMEREDINLLKESRMKLNKINKSFKSKPVFALFGASQVGKSYLIKNLLSVDGKPLEIILGEKKYDFLEKINPAGTGAESTGVVTRFSIDKPTQNVDFPVKAKLISISDLVIILTDSFLNHADLDEDINFNDFESNIEKLELEYKKSDFHQLYLNEDNIFEIRNYFKNNFRKTSLKKVLDSSNYWNRIGEIISKIPPSKWIDIFSLYWNNNNEINKLFQLLNKDLEKLNYLDTVYLSQKSILRNDGAILDVTRVKEIFDDNAPDLKVLCENKEININTNRLSAVISEITLCVSENLKTHKEFIKNTDLLDFPGARGKEEFKKVRDEETPKMFLRGKISYLFKKYSTNLEINNLLFCLNDIQIDPGVGLPKLLTEWINLNIGESLEHRSQTLSNLNSNPLFIIFTFFNNQLEFNSINDNEDGEGFDYKWNNRFNKFFKEELVSTNDWDTKWSNKNNLFNNFFLLRDYEYSSDIFDGYEEDLNEKSIIKNRIEYMNNLKDSFLKHDFVKKHFLNPSNSWDEAATANKDGSDMVIKNLLPSANNLVKINNSIKRCDDIKNIVLECLNKYYISENKEEERNKIKKNSLNISIGLSKFISNEPNKFSLFIKSLQVIDSEIYNIFHENINVEVSTKKYSSKDLLPTIYPYISDNNTLDENVEIIRKHEGLKNKEDVLEILLKNGIDLSTYKKQESINELSLILEEIIKIWKLKVKSNPCQIEENILNQILIDLEKTMKVYGLLEKIHDELSAKFNGVGNDRRKDEIYFASITTNLINEFVTFFGTKHFDESTINNLNNILSEKEKNAYAKLVMVKKLPNTNELNNIFNEDNLDINNNFTNYLSNFKEWQLRMKIALLNNCGYVDNEKNNNAIQEMISSINEIKIKI